MAGYGAINFTCCIYSALLAWFISTRRIALFSLIGLLFIDYLGYWYPMLQMLALVLTSVFFALVIGIPIGIWGSQQADSQKNYQSIIGFNADDASIRLFATSHLLLQYRGRSGSCSIGYLLDAADNPFDDVGNRASTERFNRSDRSIWFDNVAKIMKIQIPLAKPTIMAGVNQSIMLSLSMVVIASMVGAPGLGEEVYRAVTQLKTGVGFETGLSIVIVAIILDRITQHAGKKKQGGTTI